MEDFIESVTSMTVIPEFSEATSTDNLFNEDVIDENNLDDWSIDDFFEALPKTIISQWDTVCEFHLWYTKEDNNWNAAYDTNWGDHRLETTNEDLYECLKELYNRVKNYE